MYIGHIDYGTNNYVKQKKILFFSSEVPTPHYVMGIMLPQDPHPQQKVWQYSRMIWKNGRKVILPYNIETADGHKRRQGS